MRVAKGATHQKFERHVIDALGVGGIVRLLRSYPSLQQPITHGEGQALVRLPIAVHMPG